MPATDDILRIAVRHTFRDIDDMVNVYHVRLETVPTPNTNAALLADVSEYIREAYAEVQAHLQNDLDPVDITVFNVSNDAPVGVTSFGGTYAGGTGSGEVLPLATCALALLSTGVKRVQGRIYLSGMGEGELADSLWDLTFVAAYEAMVDRLLLQSPFTNLSAFAYGVYSRSSGLLRDVTATRIQRIPAFQRRRKPGRGS